MSDGSEQEGFSIERCWVYLSAQRLNVRQGKNV